jgi:hypothetical protein
MSLADCYDEQGCWPEKQWKATGWTSVGMAAFTMVLGIVLLVDGKGSVKLISSIPSK